MIHDISAKMSKMPKNVLTRPNSPKTAHPRQTLPGYMSALCLLKSVLLHTGSQNAQTDFLLAGKTVCLHFIGWKNCLSAFLLDEKPSDFFLIGRKNCVDPVLFMQGVTFCRHISLHKFVPLYRAVSCQGSLLKRV